MKRKFRAIVQSNLEPDDKQVIWLNEDYLRYYNNGEWVPLGRNKDDPNITALLLNKHISNKQNPHSVTKEQVGLPNVTNDTQIKRVEMGKSNGVATLDSTGKVPLTQLPDNIGGGNNLELGETSTTAYPGDKGKTNANAIRSLTNALDSIDSYSRATRNQLDTFKNTKGKSQGIAPLDENGKVASSYLPSYVDDVLEYNTRTAFPTTGESGKIYIALDTNKTYRWGGTTYVELKSNIALGETSSTAYAGDKGKKNREDIENLQSNQSKFNTSLADVRSSFNNYASAKTPIIDKVEPHIADKQNPHSVTKAQVGLSNVTNDAQVKRSEMGANNGVATLDDNGKVPESQLPSGVTSSLVLGETEGTAYEGSKGAKHEHTFNQFNTFRLITNLTTSSGNSGFTVRKINLSYDKDTGNITQMSGISAFKIPVADPTKTFDCGLLLNTDKKKLDSLSNYTLPTADSSTLGGIKIGSGLNIDSNGTVSVDNKLYILVNSLESVSTPDANKIYLVLNSSSTSETNSFTEYVWITSDTGSKWEKLGEASATVDLADYYTKTEINNKLSPINNSITELNSNKVDKQDVATTAKNGLLSKEDKTKLDSIETGANKYVLPEAGYNVLGGIKATSYGGAPAVSTINTKWINQKEVCGGFTYHTGMEQVYPTYSQVLEATTEKYGLMSPEDKIKLDNLSSGGSSNIIEYTEAEITALLKQIRF